MTDITIIPILPRLLEVSTACRDAFAEAAFAVRSPRLAALFVRRAEYQHRIAAYLGEQLSVHRVPFDHPLWSPRERGRTSRLETIPTGSDPYVLLGACLRVLETSILEFARVFGPLLTPEQRASLERHRDQMRWSRDELVQLRRLYKPPRTEAVQAALQAQAAPGPTRWFGERHDASTHQETWLS